MKSLHWAVVIMALTGCLELACSDGSGPTTQSKSEAIYGGTTSDLTTVGAVQIAFYDGFGDLCSVGSGTMLTNQWLLTAAHVLVEPCIPSPVKLVISEKSGGAGPRGASEWVRHQLAAGKSPADIWAEAQRIKMKFSRNLIYTVKSADGSAKDKPGPKPRNILTVNFEGSAVEEQFKTLVAKIGLSRAAELIQEATSWGRVFGVVK